MTTQKRPKNYSVNLSLLNQFIIHISTIRETPELIQKIAGSRVLIELTKEIVNATPEKNTKFWRKFSLACQQKKIDPENIKAILTPVAGSLGLVVRGNLQQDYYALLGVTPSSSCEEIRKAYYRRAKSLHPDTRKNGKDDQAFVELVDGYRVLKDPVLRAHYDKNCQNMGLWHEHSAGKKQYRDESQIKSRRNRYFLQLSGVVILMISVVFVFNLIYESQAINDGFYIPPELVEPASALNGETNGAGREIGKIEQNGLKKEPLLPDLEGKNASIPTQEIGGKTGGISHSDKNQATQPGSVASIGKKLPSAINKKLARNPGMEKGPSSFIKDESSVSIEITTDNEGLKQHARPSEPNAQAVELTRGKEKAIEKKTPLLPEKDRAKNSSEDHIRPSAALAVDRRAAHSASELLRKFVEEDDEINRVTDFIRKYSETYMKKNYSEFSKLFTKDATENGKAFSELAVDYRRVFTDLEILKYQIILYKTSFLVDQGVVRTRGKYKIAWQPYDGMLQESEGPISLEIVKQNGGYRVRKLVYGRIEPK